MCPKPTHALWKTKGFSKIRVQKRPPDLLHFFYISFLYFSLRGVHLSACVTKRDHARDELPSLMWCLCTSFLRSPAAEGRGSAAGRGRGQGGRRRSLAANPRIHKHPPARPGQLRSRVLCLYMNTVPSLGGLQFNKNIEVRCG